MTHKVSRVDGRYEVSFDDGPANLYALQMAPSRLEPELERGTWLIMSFAVWSSPDRAAIAVAARVAALSCGRLSVGVRPFDDHNELRSWCPGTKATAGSPVWSVLREGALIFEHAGLASAEWLLAVSETERPQVAAGAE